MRMCVCVYEPFEYDTKTIMHVTTESYVQLLRFVYIIQFGFIFNITKGTPHAAV